MLSKYVLSMRKKRKQVVERVTNKLLGLRYTCNEDGEVLNTSPCPLNMNSPGFDSDCRHCPHCGVALDVTRG